MDKGRFIAHRAFADQATQKILQQILLNQTKKHIFPKSSFQTLQGRMV